MTRSRLCEDEAGANGQSHGYPRDGDRIDLARCRHASHSFGAGGICSTLDDLCTWNSALHGGRVVPAGSYALTTTPQGALEPYAGTFIIQSPDRPLEMKFWVDGRTLKAQARVQRVTTLRPVGDHAFGTNADWTVRFTFTVDRGVATGLTPEQAGARFGAVRKK